MKPGNLLYSYGKVLIPPVSSFSESKDEDFSKRTGELSGVFILFKIILHTLYVVPRRSKYGKVFIYVRVRYRRTSG